MKFANLQAAIDRLRTRKKAYQFVFGPPGTPNHEFLLDIMAFCRVFETTWSDDPRHHARLEGRREVGERIRQHLNLEPDELAALYRAVVLRNAGETQ